MSSDICTSGCSLYKNYDPTKYHVHAWDIVHDWLISCFLSLFIINCFPTGSIICIWFNALKPDAIIKTLCLVKGRWTVAMEALKISWRFRCIQFQYKKIQWCQNFCCIRVLMIQTFFLVVVEKLDDIQTYTWLRKILVIQM